MTYITIFIDLDVKKDFILCTFASDKTIVVVLTQVNEIKEDHPIYFMSKSIQEHELKYYLIEKQAYALVKPIT